MNFTFSSLRTGVLAAFSGILLLSTSACNKDNDNDIVDIPVAGLMAFNLAPDVPSAGLPLSGNNAVGSLPFGSYSGGYLRVYTGSRPVESYNAASGARLSNETFNFEDSSYYSVFIVGANNAYRNVIVEDDISNLTGNGKAYVRYINAIPDSTAPVVKFAVGGTDVINESAAFAHVSGFTPVNTGDVAIQVSNSGSIHANRTVTLEANKVYTILLTGLPSTSGSGDDVQIKYITNGTLDAELAARSGNTAAKQAN